MKTPRKTTFQKLVERLRREFPELAIPEGATAHRRYGSSRQQEAGVWSWYVSGGGTRIGSMQTAQEILKAKTIYYRYPPRGLNSVQGNPEVFGKLSPKTDPTT